MLTYNTHRPRLVLPEYGRAIQAMVDYCIQIADREQRTRCAYSIINSMSKVHPGIKEQDDWKQTLWDHLAYMSGYKLDIDYPVEISAADRHPEHPDPVPYPGRYMRYRHYGHDIEVAIEKAIELPDGPEKDELILMVANHMKKLLLGVYKEGVDDYRVARDMVELSHGMIRLDPKITPLHEFKIIAPPSGKKKRKR